MWNCPHCGCQNITPSVLVCPQCFVPKDVAAEPGQPAEGSSSSPVGSQQEGLQPPPSGDNSAAAPSSLTSDKDSDWGKE